MADLNYVEVNPNISDDFKELILSQFDNAENIQSLLEIMASEATDLEQLYVDIAEGFRLENAEGVQLDIIGEFIGIEREGVNDDTYKSKIAVAIAGITLGVTRDGVVEIARLISGGVSPEVYIGRFKDVYLYMQELCFDSSIIGPQIGEYFPLNTQGSLVIVAGIPFGFEGDDGAAGFASTVTEDNIPETDFGTMSSLAYRTFDSQDFLYKYELNSDVVATIGLGINYNKPLINITGFRYFSIENVDPAQDILYISARRGDGIDDLNSLFNGTKVFSDYAPPPATLYYEVIPRSVQDYPIGNISHNLILGSVDNDSDPSTQNTLQITIKLNCEDATPKVQIIVNKINTDGTSATSTIEYTALVNIKDRPFGIYMNPVTRILGYTYDGVDQGLILADSSSDPEITVGQPFVWSDRRAYKGFFFMDGLRTTDPLADPADNISMEWIQDSVDLSSVASPEGAVDIFGRLI